MKERNSGFRDESSNTKITGLFQRITAAFPASLSFELLLIFLFLVS